MDRASIYFLDENDVNTYDNDEALPPLPLPDLRDTMQRYYESLTPFGTPAELANSRAVIAEFETGVGAQLQALLRERAAKRKNWLDDWWDTYAYLTLRIPLNPYMVMAMPVKLQTLNIPDTPENFFKNLARILYYTLEFWELLYKEKLKPLTSNRGKVKYSSNLYKRFFSTTRVPGAEVDRIDKHFRTASEGRTPSHCLISGKGRLFTFDCLHADGTILTEQELLVMLQRVRTILDYQPMGDCVSLLTHDDRTSWANNRQRLIELSSANKDTMKLIESSNMAVVFDDHEPKDYEELSQVATSGDFHSKWGDRSSTIVAYKSGKFAFVGEHTAYDGTISVSYALFVMLSMFENPEPDWHLAEQTAVVCLTELKFDLNDTIKQEVERMVTVCDEMRSNVVATHTAFEEYGKEYIKTCKLHPDSFVQVVMQLAYTQMHNEIAPTYETALMRQYYNGRTETLRSCTTEVHKFIRIATNPNSSKVEIVNAFRSAVEHHSHMMNEARKGHGVDRHLFGLWCVAYEHKMDIPEFFADPLYTKSGGNGNFVLSTSTLGYTVNVGFVAPMVLDGYGIFYTITPETIYIQSTAFRDSSKTSPSKFNATFKDTFRRMKTFLEDVKNSKL